MKDKTKANCISCKHYDDDARICTNKEGLLREIELSESLADAEHDCQVYDELTFRASPAGLLYITLEDYGYEVPFRVASSIFNRFMARMKKAGYIEDNEES